MISRRLRGAKKIGYVSHTRRFVDIDLTGRTDMFIPKGHGKDIPIPNTYRERYPARDQSMQFMSFYNATDALFVQTKDPDANIMDWEIFNGDTLRIHFYVDKVIEVFTTTIANTAAAAAAQYKLWAQDQYWYVKKTSDIEVSTMKTFSVSSSTNMSEMNTNVPTYLNQFTGNKGAWITQWRAKDFDVDYPEYVAANPTNFKTFLTTLDGISTTPFPYINGLLSDVGSSSHNTAHSIRDVYGDEQTYSVTLPNLRLQCAYFPAWRTVLTTARDLIVDNNTKISAGIYYDVLAGTEPKICYSQDHGHKSGDPLAWITGARRLLSETDGIIITEGNAECYIDLVDAFLMHLYTDESDNVNLWNAVYSSVSLSVGWKMTYTDEDELLTDINAGIAYSTQASAAPYMTRTVELDLLTAPYSNTLADIVSN